MTKETLSEFIKADPATGCWIWMRYRSKLGYGLVRFGGRQARAHRAVYELFNGPIPEGLVACHRCDNPPCVNPDHIFLGTPADNVRDCKAKGRTCVGEQRPRATATNDQVRQIRAMLANRQLSQRQIANTVGIPFHTVKNIAHNKAYKSIC